MIEIGVDRRATILRLYCIIFDHFFGGDSFPSVRKFLSNVRSQADFSAHRGVLLDQSFDPASAHS